VPAKKPKPDPIHRAILAVSPVRVGAEWFKVRVISEDDWSDGDEFRGCIAYGDGEIRIRADQTGFDAVDVLFHEVVHAVVGDRAHNKFESSDIADRGKYTDLGELFTRAAEQGLTNLFLDNPRLLALFVKWWSPLARKRSKK
jgi:hypothetical protein